MYAFEGYELDLQRYELRYDGKPVKLEPQVFNLLAYLIQHRGRVVSKEELFEQVWPGRVVSEAALTSRLMAARKAVGDTGRRQRIIQTLHGRGYRFIAAVEERPVETLAPTTPLLPRREPMAPRQSHPTPVWSTRSPFQAAKPIPPEGSVSSSQSDTLLDAFRASQAIQVVGREADLAQLHRWLQRALGGTRQVVFITGEAGMGKTTLVETFLAEIEREDALWIGRGQCLEHYGAGEAYLPVLEAVGRLCKESAGQALIALLARQAPTWLVQMPWLVNGAEFEALQRRVLGPTRERMLREMAETIEALTAERPLVLVLEDLHWSDYATLDLVTRLAQRREPARFLLLGTYRPEAVVASSHPLPGVIAALQLRQLCQELAVSALSAAEVEGYLAAYFMNDAVAVALSPTLHRRSEGNPLFMVNLLEHWIAYGWLYQQQGQWTLRPGWEAIAQEIPATLRELVMQRQARLSPTEQRLLEVASVAGLEWSAASIAAGLVAEVVETEVWCEELARRGQFLRPCGEETWPDGTVATRYRFRHALYQDVVYERIPAARQAQLHQRIALREEAGYGERSGDIAARLAMHFERGHDSSKAVWYHQQAAQQALQRSGYREAITHLNRGLELLQRMADSPERTEREVALQTALGSALKITKGFGAPAAEHAYLRARELYGRLGDPPQLTPVLYSLYELYEYRGAFHRSRELGEQLLDLAQDRHDAIILLGACDALACTSFHLGAFAQVAEHANRGLACYAPQHHHALVSLYGRDLGVSSHFWSAMALWFLGYPDQARQRIDAALAQAQELGHPYTLAVAHNRAAFIEQFRRESQATRQRAEVAVKIATEFGFPRHAALGSILRGWALAAQGQGAEGIAQIRQGMADYHELGMAMEDPYFLALLADAYDHVGRIEEGLATVAEGLRALPSERDFFYKAELYRLRGQLLWRRAAADKAQVEACFQQALEIARRQQAKSLELRASTGLSQLWQHQRKVHMAHQLLAETYGWFTEGFHTADLQEAKALLTVLA